MANELNDKFVAQPDGLPKFLSKYPLEIDAGQFAVPVGEAGEVLVGTGKEGTERGVVATLKQSVLDKSKKGLDFQVIQNKATPVWCDFPMTTSGPNEGIVFPKLYQTASSNLVKLFYLPWDADKRHALDLNGNANYFMTASMHGCRFEVHKKPGNVYHVSHSNVQPKDGLDAQGMIPYLRMADQDRGNRKLKFGKDRYYADATKLLGSAQQRMIHFGVAAKDVLEAEPETYKANVLGSLSTTTGNWWFYYQLWGWVKVRLHANVKKKKWLGLKKEYVDVTNDAYLKVVFLVQQIYPVVNTIYKLHKTAKDPYS